ncbi:DUF4174 domain-containing protein [Sulfitobacter aestuarii]|uniref:DUF4174 domain-containing protein n=1 Tax=Sulfitobacter aestuarii TaxID=2161676 RepID=A0ABW5U266_9RHOB
MKRLIPFVIIGLIAAGAGAETIAAQDEPPIFQPANEVDLNVLLWKKRPVVVFADSDFDPAFIEQMELLEQHQDELRIRDVIVLTDTDPQARGAMRLKLRPRGFMLAILGKDGRVKLRKPFPWDVREISRSIDKMPERRREIRERKEIQGNIIQ